MRRTRISIRQIPDIDRTILENVRRKKQIVYGGKSIAKQLGLFARPTKDWDIFTINPKQSAKHAERDLDNNFRGDYFYTKKAEHKGTYKVKGKGVDNKQGTDDDFNVADYTQMPKPSPKFIIINGVRYRKLSQEELAKRKAIKDPKYIYRRLKDTEDANRIRTYNNFVKIRKKI